MRFLATIQKQNGTEETKLFTEEDLSLHGRSLYLCGYRVSAYVHKDSAIVLASSIQIFPESNFDEYFLSSIETRSNMELIRHPDPFVLGINLDPTYRIRIEEPSKPEPNNLDKLLQQVTEEQP